MVAGRGVSARLVARVENGPRIVAWIGVSLANKGVGGAAAFAWAGALAAAKQARNVQPLIAPSFDSGCSRHRACGHMVADDFEPAQRTTVIARIAGIDPRQPAVGADDDPCKV